MENPKLSIIIPCFNSEKTIEEAVLSVINSNLEISYEIIIVDDGSTDNTINKIKDLRLKYRQIYFYQNEVNLGGGASRNKGVLKSNSDILFFLDSDDILDKDLLKLMYKKLIENNLDGVSIYKSVFFLNNKDNILREAVYSFQNEIIPFKSLFGDGCGLYSTFMIRKKVHYQIGEFPTNHGFDTQHYAFRFLANNKKAMSCKGAIYFHRISENSNSYYNREQKSGKINFNWFQILSEVIFLFNDDAKKFLLDFNIYESSDNLFDSLKKLNPLDYNYQIKVESDFILSNYKRLYKKENLEYHENFWLSLIEKNPEKKLFLTIESLSHQNKFMINQFIYLTEKYSDIHFKKLKKTEIARNTIKNKIIRKLKRL